MCVSACVRWDLRDRTRTFASLAATTDDIVTLTGRARVDAPLRPPRDVESVRRVGTASGAAALARTYGGVVGAVVVSALGAMWVPARRAIRLDPVRSLRAE